MPSNICNVLETTVGLVIARIILDPLRYVYHSVTGEQLRRPHPPTVIPEDRMAVGTGQRPTIGQRESETGLGSPTVSHPDGVVAMRPPRGHQIPLAPHQ